MGKVAKLVLVSLMTRVVVDDNATDESILDSARSNFIDKVRTELGENLESIVDDTECPYEEDFDEVVTCLNCGYEFTPTLFSLHIDALGKHCTCPKCNATFDK